MSNIFVGLKKTCLGVLERGDRDKLNETGLKEGGGIEMSTTVLSIYAMHALFALYPPNIVKDFVKEPLVLGVKIISIQM